MMNKFFRFIIMEFNDFYDDVDDQKINENHFIEIDKYNCCCYCHKHINGMGLSNLESDKRFCDIICAKLYELNNNVKLNLNFVLYKSYYKNELLNDESKALFKILQYIPYEYLPLTKDVVDKNKYIQILINYVNVSLV